ncbi:hypothetical protein CN367_11735 [Priestia megaterium]|uniref:phage major capsid protein n=1 Tax=Priestia megaterium TaxID=1404 RepID=UPI000BFA0AA2|nr:hypothetical protein [Priestia megaterium]PEZ47032.1 hypothetical protein CN367_11735 [Priestia megaterium]
MAGKDLILGQHPLLKKEFVDRRIRELVGHQFVADQLFTHTTVDALALRYMQDADSDAQGRKAYDAVPEVGEASNFKRIGIDEEEKTAMIKKYGLETVISYEMQKFGSDGSFDRSYRKLALNVKKMVDDMAYKVATNNYTIGGGIQGKTKSGSAGDVLWTDTTNGAEQMISDIIDARKALKSWAYQADTVVINPEIEAIMLKNKNIRDAFRENNTDVALLKGYIGDFMQLSFIVDENFADDNVLFLQKKTIGEIADAEGLRSKVYNEDSQERTIARVTRFTSAYLTDPKAVYLLKNVR